MEVYHQTLAAILLLLNPSPAVYAEAAGIFNEPPSDHSQQANGIVHAAANAALRGDRPGQGQGVTPPNQTPASPDDCLIVAIASTRHPEGIRRTIDDGGGHDFHDRRINQLFQHNNDDDGETFVCEYGDGTTAQLVLSDDQLIELRQMLNGSTRLPGDDPFLSAQHPLSIEGTSIGPDGSIHIPPGVSISNAVRQNRGPPGDRHLRGRQQSRRRTAEVVGDKHVLVSLRHWMTSHEAIRTYNSFLIA